MVFNSIGVEINVVNINSRKNQIENNNFLQVHQKLKRKQPTMKFQKIFFLIYILKGTKNMRFEFQIPNIKTL